MGATPPTVVSTVTVLPVPGQVAPGGLGLGPYIFAPPVVPGASAFATSQARPEVIWAPGQALVPGQMVIFGPDGVQAAAAALAGGGAGGAGGVDGPGGTDGPGSGSIKNDGYRYEFIPGNQSAVLEVRIVGGKPQVRQVNFTRVAVQGDASYLSYVPGAGPDARWTRLWPRSMGERTSEAAGAKRMRFVDGYAWLSISPDGALAIDTSFSQHIVEGGTRLMANGPSGSAYVAVEGPSVRLLPVPASERERARLNDLNTLIAWRPGAGDNVLFEEVSADHRTLFTAPMGSVFRGSPAEVSVAPASGRALMFGPPSLETRVFEGEIGRGVTIMPHRDSVVLYAYLDGRHHLALSAYPALSNEPARTQITGRRDDSGEYVWLVGSTRSNGNNFRRTVEIGGVEFYADRGKAQNRDNLSLQPRRESMDVRYVLNESTPPRYTITPQSGMPAIRAIPDPNGKLEFRAGLQVIGAEAIGLVWIPHLSRWRSYSTDGGSGELQLEWSPFSRPASSGGDDPGLNVPDAVVGPPIRAGRHAYSISVGQGGVLKITPRPYVFAGGTTPAISLNGKRVTVIEYGTHEGLYLGEDGTWHYALRERHFYNPLSWFGKTLGSIKFDSNGSPMRRGRLVLTGNVPTDPEDGFRVRAGDETLLFTP